MGTRGAIGFRSEGQIKVTYNHFDSYPSVLGVEMLNLVRKHTDERLMTAAKRVQLVDRSSTPTEEQVARYEQFADTGVSTGSLTEWYVLLRNAQGSLEPFVTGLIDHMIDSHDFLEDGLFCEWAYIVDCDLKALEVHAYGAVRATIPLDEVRRMSEDEFLTLVDDSEDED